MAPHTYGLPIWLYARSTMALPVLALYDGWDEVDPPELDPPPDELVPVLEPVLEDPEPELESEPEPEFEAVPADEPLSELALPPPCSAAASCAEASTTCAAAASSAARWAASSWANSSAASALRLS